MSLKFSKSALPVHFFNHRNFPLTPTANRFIRLCFDMDVLMLHFDSISSFLSLFRFTSTFPASNSMKLVP